MTDLLDLAEFSSDQFSPRLGEDAQVNPHVYGAELAYWLATELASRGIRTRYPDFEDWGWFVDCTIEADAIFAIHCGNVDGSPDRWFLQLRRLPAKRFGRGKPDFSRAKELVTALEDLLATTDSIEGLDWRYSD